MRARDRSKRPVMCAVEPETWVSGVGALDLYTEAGRPMTRMTELIGIPRRTHPTVDPGGLQVTRMIRHRPADRGKVNVVVYLGAC